MVFIPYANVQVLPFFTQRQVTGIDLLLRKDLLENIKNKNT